MERLANLLSFALPAAALGAFLGGLAWELERRFALLGSHMGGRGTWIVVGIGVCAFVVAPMLEAWLAESRSGESR